MVPIKDSETENVKKFNKFFLKKENSETKVWALTGIGSSCSKTSKIDKQCSVVEQMFLKFLCFLCAEWEKNEEKSQDERALNVFHSLWVQQKKFKTAQEDLLLGLESFHLNSVLLSWGMGGASDDRLVEWHFSFANPRNSVFLFLNDKKRKDFLNIWQNIMALQCTTIHSWGSIERAFLSYFPCKWQFLSSKQESWVGGRTFIAFCSSKNSHNRWHNISDSELEGIMNWHARHPQRFFLTAIIRGCHV